MRTEKVRQMHTERVEMGVQNQKVEICCSMPERKRARVLRTIERTKNLFLERERTCRVLRLRNFAAQCEKERELESAQNGRKKGEFVLRKRQEIGHAQRVEFCC